MMRVKTARYRPRQLFISHAGLAANDRTRRCLSKLSGALQGLICKVSAFAFVRLEVPKKTVFGIDNENARARFARSSITCARVSLRLCTASA